MADIPKPRTHVTFETDMADDGRPESMPGKYIADYLQGELVNRGFQVGCGMDCRYSHDFTVTVQGRTFHCMLGPIGGDLHFWMLQTESHGGWLPKFVLGDDTRQLTTLMFEINRAIQKNPNITRIRWYKSASHVREFDGTDYTVAP
ncbi:MAG TPA: hypothetical protein ENN67_05360 [Firmicutes bacterium]|nr:hypothetical protein [Bacillota bacterium]